MTPVDARLRSRVADLFSREAEGLRLETFEPMPDGHAGHTFGLDLRRRDGEVERYILKIGPAGVPRRGSTDIFRQAQLLRALHTAGLPTPNVRWASPEDDDLGAPYIVMERMRGRTLIVWDPHPAFLADAPALPELWIAGAAALADIHRISHETILAGWETRTSLQAELTRWGALVRHTQDPVARGRLADLADVLGASAPPDAPVGLTHGDFQPGNILYDQGAIAGVVDWDLATVGPQGMDVGWYLMMADAEAWPVGWRPLGAPPQGELIAAYADAGGPAVGGLAWHQAFAHFRFGAITGLNLKLHRDGRRVDAIWETFAAATSGLVDAAETLLKQGRAT